MSDQADQLRQLVRKTVNKHPALEPGVPLVAISGGKGGVGASTVATQLAHELARLGKRIMLVDANPQQPDISTRFAGDFHGCLADVLSGTRSAGEVIKPLADSVQLLPGRWAPSSPPELGRDAVRRLLAEIRSLHRHADLAILDAGDGMSPWIGQLWKAAHQVLLVTTPESVAVMDSYAAVKLAPWGDIDGKVRLAVNQCDHRETAQRVGQRFAATCRRFLGLNIDQPAAAIASASTAGIDSTHVRSIDNSAFHDSIRLLAAEVLSNCLAIASRCNRQTIERAEKNMEFSNKAQTLSQK